MLNLFIMLRTIRKSFQHDKHRKGHESSCSKDWQKDKEKVKAAKCSFPVKYIGSIEVQESRGTHICEQAMKQLKSRKKKKVRAILYISSDALKLVENSTKTLLFDQIIEKVSFCSPDSHNKQAFSYICRDGTTRRWLCYSFFAVKESGERLSHAIGCAFAACLENNEKRKKAGANVTCDKSRTTLFREGSLQVSTPTAQQGQSNLSKPVDWEKVQVYNSSAIPRPHAPPHLIRQASLRQFGVKTEDTSLGHGPFKRHHSLQIKELPSTISARNFTVMSPVPEMEEPSNACQPITNAPPDNHNNPFTNPPLFSTSATLKQANGFGGTQMPTLVNNSPSAGFATRQAGWTDEDSPDVFTNAWTASAHLSKKNERMTSQADLWLSSIQQLTGSVPMETNAHLSHKCTE